MSGFELFAIDFLQAFTAGLMIGGTYALMCVGLGMIFGVMRVVNFAQGDFLMLGMYAAYYVATAAGVLLVREAGGFVTDYRGADRAFERREYVAGSSAIHSKLQKLIAGSLR